MIDLDSIMKSPKEILLTIANNEKARRKRAGFTQQELALRADVSLPSLRISLSSLVKIATVLDDQDSFLVCFLRGNTHQWRSS